VEDIADEVVVSAPVDRPAATRVRAESVSRPKLLTRLMTPVIRRKFHQAQRAILDGLRQHVEH
jgi:hypothetical protein